MSAAGSSGLQVRDLTVTFRSNGRDVPAVRRIDLDVKPGSVLALVGESGSGKSASMLGLLGLLPAGARVSGTATVNGVDLLGVDNHDLRRVRGKDVGVIFQDPMTSLNPVHTIGRQVAEAVLVHDPARDKRRARARAAQILERVGIPAADERFDSYPHEFSGGMRQRVMIAVALVNSPAVVVADEPTTALDVTVQAQILELLAELCSQSGTGLVLVTHDLGVVAGIADEVAVMYAGRIVERGPVDQLFYEHAHPYTRGLLAAVPRLDLPRFQPEPIRGTPLSAGSVTRGCSFAARCDWAVQDCLDDEPVLRSMRPGHRAACFHAELVASSPQERTHS